MSDAVQRAKDAATIFWNKEVPFTGRAGRTVALLQTAVEELEAQRNKTLDMAEHLEQLADKATALAEEQKAEVMRLVRENSGNIAKLEMEKRINEMLKAEVARLKDLLDEYASHIRYEEREGPTWENVYGEEPPH